MPQILKVDSNQSLKNYSKYIRNILKSGGVIAFPTDTFYGLGVDPFNEKGIRRVFEIKSRSYNKPLLVLISTKAQINQLALNRSQEAERLVKRCWPAPLTLIFNAVPSLPDILTSNTGKIATRLPKSAWTRHLIQTVGFPLTATSANKNGEKDTQTAQEVLNSFGNSIDLIIDPGPAPGGKVSTLLDTTKTPPTILRTGAITQQEIDSCLSNESTLVS
ncbi:MAG: threonylcarbamoyl-AMP synthase [Nitrospina sp.]|jgi:L-threonylcarbamoyladenylate synthase|nr:threonylcarbamoyl-AMP synthase [Nitrospina sp.]MBT6600058.1 threonylcarbamoyl-AMP synthase [Nitrospina sp.]